MSKILCTDVDGVLLNWHKGFTDWVYKEYNWNLNEDHPKDTYDMQSWFLPKDGVEMTGQTFTDLVIEYNSFPRVLDLIPYAYDALFDIEDSGYKIIALTSFSSCPNMGQFRKDYLNMVFDNVFDDIIVLGLGECKEESLKRLKPDYFVEDNKDHADKAVGLGIKTFLINYPFNQGSKAKYVKNWFEIEESLI